MSKFISEQKIDQIQNDLGNYELLQGLYPHVGLRVTNADYDDYDAQLGDRLDPSSNWVDGEPTDDELPGTCAIRLDRHYTHPATHRGYFGDRILLIGSDEVYPGEDPCEGIYPNAVVIGVIQY